MKFDVDSILQNRPVTPKAVLKTYKTYTRDDNYLYLHQNGISGDVIWTCVQTGNIIKLKEFYSSYLNTLDAHNSNLKKHNYPKLSEHSLIAHKYSFIGAITMACRMAILGGLPRETAWTLSDSYIIHMDTLNEINEITALSGIAIFDLTLRVNEQKNNHSIHMKTARAYINNHIYEKIEKSQICKACKISASYVSILFKNELNCTLKQYIVKEKIIASLEQLLYSDTSILNISLMYSFSSPNSYGKYFKEVFGMNPSQYRILNSAFTK